MIDKPTSSALARPRGCEVKQRGYGRVREELLIRTSSCAVKQRGYGRVREQLLITTSS